MKFKISIFLVAAAAAFAISPHVFAGGKKGVKKTGSRTGSVASGSGAVASPNAIRAKKAGDLVFGDPIRYQNISLVPVGTTAKGPFTKYTLLEKGLAAKTFAVRELNGKSGDAQVPAVEVRNKGKAPVYLLGGEMILGGKQDRIISADTVIDPGGKWTKVNVFCVEQGRWRGQNMKFSAGKALAHVGLQRAAMSGSQGSVWKEVARKNIKHGNQSSTSTYRRTIQDAKLRRKISPYRKTIASRLPKGMSLAGMVFAINGKIRVVDLFGNPELYASLQEKLLSSYILEALGQKVVRNAPVISKGAASNYLQKARRTKKNKFKGSGRSDNYRMEDAQVIGNETYDKKTGKKVRETYIMK